MLGPKRRSSLFFAGPSAGSGATSSADTRSSLAETQAAADDTGQTENRSHQHRSTDTICVDAAEARWPLRVGKRQPSGAGVGHRQK